MTFQYTIKKCKITVDGKTYTKNEISISDTLMFISYSKPNYSGRVMVSMINPSSSVSNVLMHSRSTTVTFAWKGPWTDEDTGKESKKTLNLKISFDREGDAIKFFNALKKQLPLKKGRHTRRKSVRKNARKTKQNVQKQSDLKQIIKSMSDEKILKLMKGRSFDTDTKHILYQAKTWPEKYFTKDELLKYSKSDTKESKKKDRKGPDESATKYPVGTEKLGNDGNTWVINVSKKGVQRWIKQATKSARGKNKPLEKLWTDMSNMKKLVFVFKDGSYKIHKIKRDDYEKKIEEGNNDPNVKAILTAGNSFDGYQQLYDRVKQSSVSDVLKDYKKYWKYKMGGKLLTC